MGFDTHNSTKKLADLLTYKTLFLGKMSLIPWRLDDMIGIENPDFENAQGQVVKKLFDLSALSPEQRSR